MTLLVLVETSAGYALFKAKDKKLLKRENLAADTATAEDVCNLLRLKQFQKFENATTALEEVSALVEGKVSPMLASLLDTVKDEKKVSLAVADPKLGNAINKLPSIELKPVSDSSTADLYRAIRNHLPSLIPGLLPQELSTMSLGLSHSLSRHKLKFSPDKVDTMIVQAIALLDDLDKELNTYAMRVKEWYGWHFPEMGRIVNDNLAYANVILKMGMRSNAANADLSDVLPEEIEAAVKAAAEISMGTEITNEDLDNIQALAEQVVSFTEYRQQLSSYLSARMTSIAPNLTALVGELVGARLIAHAGSLVNLAKAPASTIQILGAEKALFRALKTKHDTPKYGLIYHASLIGQATGKNKGKIARMVATKAAIGVRVDALSDWGTNNEGNADDVPDEEKAAISIESRAKIERRLRALEGRPIHARVVAVDPARGPLHQPGKWEIKEARKYNPDADGLAGDEPAATEKGPMGGDEVPAALPSKPTEDGDVKMIEEINDDGDAKEDEVMANGEVQEAKEDVDEEGDEDEDTDDEEDEDEDDDLDTEEEDEDEDEDDGEDSDEDDEIVEANVQAAPPATAPAPGTNGEAQQERVDIPAPPPTDFEVVEYRDPYEGILMKRPDGRPTRAARKIKKAERKAARAAMLADKKKLREEKIARRLARQERRQSKRAKAITPAEEAEFGPMAQQVGLSILHYKQKLTQGEIVFKEDGTPIALSKKELKQRKKALRMQAKKQARQARKAKKEERRQQQQQKKTQKRKRGPEGASQSQTSAQPPAPTSDKQPVPGVSSGGDASAQAQQATLRPAAEPVTPEGGDRKRRKLEAGTATNGDQAGANDDEGAAKKKKKRKRDEAEGDPGLMADNGAEKVKEKKKKKKSKE